MIDAEALEVLSANEVKGFPHKEMMKGEGLMFQQGLLDISCIGAYLSRWLVWCLIWLLLSSVVMMRIGGDTLSYIYNYMICDDYDADDGDDNYRTKCTFFVLHKHRQVNNGHKMTISPCTYKYTCNGNPT